MLHSIQRDSTPTTGWRGYAGAIAATAAATLVTMLIRNAWLGAETQFTPFALFMVAIAFSGWYGGLGPGLLTTVLGGLISLYFFLDPLYSFALDQPGTQGRLFVYVVGALLINLLSEARAGLERGLREQGAQLRVTLESIGDAVIAADAEGRVVFMNAVAEQLTGWDQSPAQGRPLSEVFNIVDEGSRKPAENPASRVLREGVVVGLANHTCLVARDGSERPIDDSGAPIRDRHGRIAGVVLVFRDVSERRAAEREREKSLAAEQEARLAAEAAHHRLSFLAEASAVLSSSLDYAATLSAIARLAVPRLADLCIVDLLDEEGRLQQLVVEHSDPASARLAHELGPRYTSGPRTGGLTMRTIESGRLAYFPRIDDDLLRAAARDEEHFALLKQIGFSSAIIAPLLVRDRPLGAITLATTASGRHYGEADVSLAEDLARRAAVAVENARLYAEAQQAIALRDQFLSIASHELKTPLTSLVGFAQILERRAAREGTLGQRDLHALRMVVQQAFRMNQLIAGVLDVSRIQSGQLSIERGAVDLVALARRVAEELRPTLASHSILVQAPEKAVTVPGDALRLEQVLQNLVQNAVKYSPGGGPITISVDQGLDSATISVADRGIGIPAGALPRLFTRFYRAPNVEERGISGIGIGLFVVREIVALHGGTIDVQSVEGQGSTFIITLPLHSPAPQPQTPSAAPA